MRRTDLKFGDTCFLGQPVKGICPRTILEKSETGMMLPGTRVKVLDDFDTEENLVLVASETRVGVVHEGALLPDDKLPNILRGKGVYLELDNYRAISTHFVTYEDEVRSILIDPERPLEVIERFEGKHKTELLLRQYHDGRCYGVIVSQKRVISLAIRNAEDNLSEILKAQREAAKAGEVDPRKGKHPGN